ncbi:hypothetical protein DBR32_07525 [Taibaiella sp. KBW10]|uniref:type IX secretion system protein PorG n=1 Tax=Taibaiella sp. KBW10 TaxID=2153357 RepID=UPI000F598E35|nr:DUF6089 family protein [Taibaiella sp. KBW10]RQO31783.1 hypothetical protein DBR32_07525 [Taibaiella sp. KBW10]
MKKIILPVLVALPLLVTAQRHHEIGLTAGASSFYGDLQPNILPDNNKMFQPTVGLLYKYFVSPRLGFRFGANYIRLTAADSLSLNKTYEKRNLSFSNNVGEIYGAIEFNFLAVDQYRFKVSPYIFAGVGAFYSNPFAYDEKGEKQVLRDLSTEGQGIAQYPDRKAYPLINAAFPIGGGVKFFIGKTIMLAAEVNMRYTSTDYIDDVSRSYVNLDTLRAYKGTKAVDMSYRGNQSGKWDGNYPNYKFQRGDFKGNDWYWTAGITATVYFDAFGNAKKYLQSRCPKVFGRGR